jgi:hypothetical protein
MRLLLPAGYIIPAHFHQELNGQLSSQVPIIWEQEQNLIKRVAKRCQLKV